MDLKNIYITTMTDSDKILLTNELIKRIHDCVRDGANNDDLGAGQFKDVRNFLTYSTEALLDFTEGRMSYNEVIDYIDLCKDGNSHFKWYCKDLGCDI
jgi:hypothetical protein